MKHFFLFSIAETKMFFPILSAAVSPGARSELTAGSLIGRSLKISTAVAGVAFLSWDNAPGNCNNKKKHKKIAYLK